MTTAAHLSSSAPSVGLVGWRGMVGSVLMQRMQDEGDFRLINPVFFSTSNAGGAAPSFAEGAGPLQNAYDVEALAKLPSRRVTACRITTPDASTAAGPPGAVPGSAVVLCAGDVTNSVGRRRKFRLVQ